jgi:hypothetical protein
VVGRQAFKPIYRTTIVPVRQFGYFFDEEVLGGGIFDVMIGEFLKRVRVGQ